MEQENVSVQFCFHHYADDDQSDGFTCVAEPVSTADFALVEQALEKNAERSGELVITSTGNDEVRIKDSLDALVMQLCFESQADLRAKKHVVVGHYLVYGYIRLDPEGDLSLLSGDFIAKVRVPREQFAVALFEAGVRYIEVIRHLSKSHEDYADLLEMLEDYRTDAEAAIATTLDSKE